MPAKTSAKVVIDGKVYTLSGYEGEEYLQKVAAYINNKISELDTLDNTRHLPPNMKNILIELNLADDFFKAKAQIQKLEEELERKDKDIYDLKHDLIASQMKTANAEERIIQLELENQDLLLNKTRLEATLEESLLDKKNHNHHGKK